MKLLLANKSREGLDHTVTILIQEIIHRYIKLPTWIISFKAHISMIKSIMSRLYIRFSFTRLDVMINFLRRMEILYWFWEMKVQMSIKMFSVPLLLRTGRPCHWGKLVFTIKYLNTRFIGASMTLRYKHYFFSFSVVLLLITLNKKITGIVTLKRSMST